MSPQACPLQLQMTQKSANILSDGIYTELRAVGRDVGTMMSSIIKTYRLVVLRKVFNLMLPMISQAAYPIGKEDGFPCPRTS